VAEQGRRRGMVVAVAVRPCSPRGASEHGEMEHARASWSRGDAISVPGSAGGGVEGGCRRGGGSGFTGGNGGTVFLRFRPRGEQSSVRVGRGASRGGEETLGCWNRDGQDGTARIFRRMARRSA
jgi:hypothetical protein